MTGVGGKANGGRASAKLAALLREEILCGRIGAGDFLATERELAGQHRLARKTVGRALKVLEAEGLILSSPRHGHRVLSRAHDPARGAPLAYVRATTEDPRHWGDLHGYLLAAMQKLAEPRGWSLLALNSGNRSPFDIAEQLRSARVCGVVLDTSDAELLDMIRRAGLPAVMVDTWVEDSGIDSIVQDSYLGGLQAARWLAERGHKRVAWFGPVGESFQSRERFGGAAAALAAAGLDLPAQLRVESPAQAPSEAKARRLLARRGRPTAVIAMWRGQALAVAGAARQLGLVLGRDLDLVGWSLEEEYESGFRACFRDGPAPPAVTWKVRDMAEAAMLRLVERRQNPEMAAVQIRIPTRLRFDGERV